MWYTSVSGNIEPFRYVLLLGASEGAVLSPVGVVALDQSHGKGRSDAVRPSPMSLLGSCVRALCGTFAIRDSGAVEKAGVFSLSGLLVIRFFSRQSFSQNWQEVYSWQHHAGMELIRDCP